MRLVKTAALFIAIMGFSSASAMCAEPAAPAIAPVAPATPGAPADSVANQPDTAAELCVSLVRIQSTRIVDDRTIVFEMTGNETLVNHLPHRCPGLKPQKGFGYQTSLSQLCSTDIIWVLENYAGGLQRGASCGLGKFEPYVQPETVTAPDANGKLEPAVKP